MQVIFLVNYQTIIQLGLSWVNGHVVQNNACNNDGADPVWGPSDLWVEDMKPLFYKTKGAFNDTAGGFMGSIELPLWSCSGLGIGVH